MSNEAEDRIHAATPTRQQSFWREGQFVKSFELAAAVQIIGGLIVAGLMLGSIGQWMKTEFLTIWSEPFSVGTDSSSLAIQKIQTVAWSLLAIIVPFGLLMMVMGVLANWFQTGPVFLPGHVRPEMGRVSPRHWFARMFSWSGLGLPLICVPKIVLALVVMMVCMWMFRDSFFELGTLTPDKLMDAIFRLTLRICGCVAATLLLLSGVDYFFKALEYQRRIRMTDQELRDEERMQNRRGSSRKPLRRVPE